MPPVVPPATTLAPAPITNAVASERISNVVELPSKGRFNPEIPAGLVELFPMTTRDEALLVGMGENQISDVFDAILGRCIKSPTLDLGDMLLTDKFYLVLMLRANSYGSEYTFPVACSWCKADLEHTCQIPTDFTVTEGEGDEPFEVVLPFSKKKIIFRLLRGKDEDDIDRFSRREKAKGKEDNKEYIYRLAKHIVTIDGKVPENINAAMEFASGLLGLDSVEFRNAIDDATPGVDTILTAECKRCKRNFKIEMPFTAGFFRPRRKTAKRNL
jgi:hypothetical protein